MYGYHGRYLLVDATVAKGYRLPLDEHVVERFLGGSGLGVYLLLKHDAAELPPLADGSLLSFVFSPLVGSPLTTSAKFAVLCKSPLTDRINDSLASSTFAIAGKKTGFDALVITGAAREPSLLIVDDGHVRFESAADLWGTTCRVAEAELRKRFPGDYQFAVIGPAGERMVRYATISHDGRHAGRGGSGAVLGAKRIKAVVVRGLQQVAWAKPSELAAFAKAMSRASMGPATAKYRELGTASNLLLFNRLKTLPTRNFQKGSFSQAEHLAPETLESVARRTRKSCAACTIGCEHIYSINASENASDQGVRLEYENLFALGSLCEIGDVDVVLQASRRCDEVGIDTISAGGTIAFAMECVERGLLDAPWLRFGDGNALLRAIDEIGTRRGLGDLLAEGSRRLAEGTGPQTQAFAAHVKGLELPGYEPRTLNTMALGLAVGTRGADHNRSSAYEADFSEYRTTSGSSAAVRAIETEDRAALMDSLILCKFVRAIFDDFFAETAELLNLVTGWSTTPGSLRCTAQRIVSAKKLFNIRAGWDPSEDRLPERFVTESLKDDAGIRLSRDWLADAVEAYNLARGWTVDGWLEAPLLSRLELDGLSSPTTPPSHQI